MHPIIKPMKTEEYEVDQSKYPHVAKLPTRALILAPSGGGKTILIQNMILDIYIAIAFQGSIFFPLLSMLMLFGILLFRI